MPSEMRSCHIAHVACSTREAELHIQNMWYVPAFQSLWVTQSFEMTVQRLQTGKQWTSYACSGMAMIVRQAGYIAVSHYRSKTGRMVASMAAS